jgi:tetratricopeptide (TPR) repeat protein
MPVDLELRKAAAYISTGKTEAAYKILSRFLKDFPDSDLAWLLLSYTIDDPRKQLASVTRALKLNPENTEAKNRLDKLMEMTADRSPSASGSNGDHLEDWPSIYSDSQSDFNSWGSRPLSVEERLAFVTLEAGSSRGHTTRDHPAQSFFTDRLHDRGFERKGKPSFRLKYLLIGAISLILIVAVAVVAIKFLNGGFISKADAEATASIETAVALATMEARGKLPPTWTPTITPTVTLTPTPSITPTLTPSPTFDQPNPTVSAEIMDLQDQISALRGLPSQEMVNTYIVMRSKVRSLLSDYYLSDENAEDEINDSAVVLSALGLIF